jgi:hypothetical protein
MKIRQSFIFITLGLSVGVAVACGGGTTSSPDSGTSSSSGSSSSGTTSSSGTGSSGTGASSSGSSSSGGGFDAASIIPPGATPGTGMVPCGNAMCTDPNICCSGGGGGGLACMTLAACNAAGRDIYTCMGQANCTAPQICCVTPGGMGMPDLAVCQATCGAGNSGQVCQSNAECPTGTTCRGGFGNGIPGAFMVCQPPLMLPAGTTGGSGPVPCGASTCTAPNNVCCSGGGGGGGGLVCNSLAGCDTAGNDSYTCTGQANCTAPQVCCVTFGAFNGNDVAGCQTSCAGGSARLCQNSAECLTGMVCLAGGNAGGGNTVPAGFMSCQTPVTMPDAGQDTGAGEAAAPDTGAPSDASGG